MNRHPFTRRLGGALVALTLVGALACAPSPPDPPSGAPPEVHITFYPWYGNPETDGRYLHWTHQVLASGNTGSVGTAVAPDDIGADFFPEAGLYSSNDPATVDRQMSEIAGAGIDVVVVSWWGPGSFEDRTVPLILDAAAEHDLRVTFLIEPSFKDVSQVRSWIVYLIDTYGEHRSFYRSADQGGRPLFYTFNPFKWSPATNAIALSPLEWTKLLTPGGSATIRGTAHDAALVGHVSQSILTHVAALAGFDAVNNYFVSSSSTIEGTTLGFPVSGDTSTWLDMVTRARSHGIDFYPSVGPGYKDLRIRPWNVATTRDRRNGAYYAGMVNAACRTKPDIISITSYNEWHEGTQIEPTVEHVTPVTSYPGFERGPDQYLDQTREWVAAFKAGTLC